MEISRNWIIAGVAAVCFITGVALSHVIEPGVRVEKVMLTSNTPALPGLFLALTRQSDLNVIDTAAGL